MVIFFPSSAKDSAKKKSCINTSIEKTYSNLTTSITSLAFHPSGEALAFASKWEKDSLRLAHVESKTVFANWPTAKTPLKYVSGVAFSERQGYVAIGNDKGKALLYRLSHYT